MYPAGDRKENDGEEKKKKEKKSNLFWDGEWDPLGVDISQYIMKSEFDRQ